MTNDSSTGGYLIPARTGSPYAPLSFTEFLQSVLVGISGLRGSLVRPKWQPNPPKQPDIDIDWMAFGLSEDDSDTFAFEGQLSGTSPNQLMRMENLTVQTTFYGPNSFETCTAFRDGLQLSQNREALQKVKMDVAYSDRMLRIPDLVNERWVDRWNMDVHLRREVIRSYPILTFLSGSGTVVINDQGDGTKTIPIAVEA